VKPVRVLKIVCGGCGHRQVAVVERLGDCYTLVRTNTRPSRLFDVAQDKADDEYWHEEERWANRNKRVDLVRQASGAPSSYDEAFRAVIFAAETGQPPRVRDVVVACHRHGQLWIRPDELLEAARKAAAGRGSTTFVCTVLPSVFE
jgi:hypothetical protein